MKKLGLCIVISITALAFSYADVPNFETPEQVSEYLRPKDLAVDNTQSTGSQINDTPKIYDGKQIVLQWAPSPLSALWHVLFVPNVCEFSYYKISIYHHDTGEVVSSYLIYQREPGSYQIPDAIDETGVYDIVIQTWCVRSLWIIQYNPVEYNWPTGTSQVTIVVDHTPPPRPISVPEPKTNIPKDGWLLTNENSVDDEGNPGHVTLTWQAATDAGPLIDHPCSGIAGYKLYEAIPLGSGEYSPIATSLDGTAPEIPVEHMIHLTEGRHRIRLTAFDNITVLVNGGELSAVTESDPSMPVQICVDRTGPQAVVINTDSLTPISGKTLRFVTKENGISWTVPSDLPSGIGIGTYSYDVHIKNTETPEVVIDLTPIPTTDTNIVIPDTLASGKYSIVITPIDELGNPGTPNEAVYFGVDATKPPTLDPNSFGINDGLAQRSVTASPPAVTFQTKQKSCMVTFSAVSDGNGDYDSGLAGYRLYRENGARTDLETNSIALEGLSSGMNRFTVTAVDKVGNESAPLTLEIKIPTLQPVTFPTPCYILESNIYYLRWNVPLDENVLTDIAQYKVIVQGRTQAPPAYADFASRDSVSELRYTLESVNQGVDLAGYVLAVATDGAWSIGSKEFNLPPLNVTGDEPRTLTGDEYWGPGIYNLYQSVIVPAGIILHILDATTVRVHGSGGIYIRITGKLDSAGSGTGIVFQSGRAETSTIDWKGIIASGEVNLQNTSIQNAERGIAALPSSAITITGGSFIACRVGIHAGTELTATGTHFQSCEWYGVKEDAIVNDKRPKLVKCIFQGNGALYYHATDLILSLSQLNGLNGNSENEEK